VALKGASLGLERGGRLIVAVAAATVLGRTVFGEFVFCSTVTAMLALAADLGLGIWTTRALARDGAEQTRIVRLGLELRTFAAVPYALVVAVAAALAGDEMRAPMLWFGLAALLNAYSDHFGAILRGRERFTDEARLNAVRAVVSTATALAAVAVGRSLPTLSAAIAIASAIGCAYGLVGIIGTPAVRQGGRFDRAHARDALRQSLPIWFAGLVSLVYFRMDTVFLHVMSGDAELGAYGAAYKFFDGALLLPAVLLAVAFPRLARVHGDSIAQRRLERQIIAVLLGLGLLVGAFCFFGSELLVQVVFGAGFERSQPCLAVLAMGLPVLYVNAGLTHLLVARNQERATALLALMMLVLNVLLDASLIPRGGGPGAGAATILSELALTTGCLFALRSAARLPAPR
jgi:O-antigen/teichoic acid export membrane protein